MTHPEPGRLGTPEAPPDDLFEIRTVYVLNPGVRAMMGEAVVAALNEYRDDRRARSDPNDAQRMAVLSRLTNGEGVSRSEIVETTGWLREFLEVAETANEGRLAAAVEVLSTVTPPLNHGAPNPGSWEAP